jgi:hypothetical protein
MYLVAEQVRLRCKALVDLRVGGGVIGSVARSVVESVRHTLRLIHRRRRRRLGIGAPEDPCVQGLNELSAPGGED